jgi:hypothetical protein
MEKVDALSRRVGLGSPYTLAKPPSKKAMFGWVGVGTVAGLIAGSLAARLTRNDMVQMGLVAGGAVLGGAGTAAYVMPNT